MGKPAVNRRPQTLIGGLAVLGLATTLAVTTPSAAGAQTRDHYGGFKVVGKLFFLSGFAAGSDGAIYVSNCSIAPAGGMGPQLCPTGGQVVRIS